MEIITLDTVDSTNSWAKRHLNSFDKKKIYCISADAQENGRGQKNKKWLSPKGQNIYATFYFHLTNSKGMENLANLLANSCYRLLKDKNFQPQIKAPNDILLSQKKVAGVLCESISSPQGVDVILGIGLNVNMEQELLETIDQPATSLKVESGHLWDRQALLQELQQYFLKDLTFFQKEDV